MGLTEPEQHGNDLDRLLVANFLGRREEFAFREIYRRHAPSLNRMILRFVGGGNGDAEDVVQNTWIRAIENLETFRWESSLRTWLMGIAVNCSRELLKRRKRDMMHDSVDSLELPAPARIRHEISRIDLERAVDRLPTGYREVLILHDVEGYTHEEIGDFLGIQSGTSKSQLSRARSAVRVTLGESNGAK